MGHTRVIELTAAGLLQPHPQRCHPGQRLPTHRAP